jgi:Na+/phosphate symporter
LPIFPHRAHRPHAVDEAVREIHWQLFGGLGLFVLCMLVMTYGLRGLPGDYFNRVLARFTNRENLRHL